MLCVANAEEAGELIELGWARPILLLGTELAACHGKGKDELAQWLVENDVRVTPAESQDLQVLAEAGRRIGKPAHVHFMLDTGMSRMGLAEHDLEQLIAQAADNQYLFAEGLYTHLATADEADKSFANQQLRRFDGFISKLGAAGIRIPITHAANSAAVLDMPGCCYEMVRPGIAVYGYYPSAGVTSRPELRPSLTLVARLLLVKQIPAHSYIGYGCTYRAERDMTIGLVPIGYGDGYDRRLSNRGRMTVAGRLAEVVGRVSMDLTVVDLTAVVKQGISVSAGMEVTVIDSNRAAANSVESIAAELGTIPYEVVTRLGRRVHRVAGTSWRANREDGHR